MVPYRHPIPNMKMTPNFGMNRIRSPHTIFTGIKIRTKSLTVFVIAVARYMAGLLIQEPQVIVISQPFWIGLQAKIRARASAMLYPEIMKATR